jgi:hypothetical protein
MDCDNPQYTKDSILPKVMIKQPSFVTWYLKPLWMMVKLPLDSITPYHIINQLGFSSQSYPIISYYII